MQQNLKVSVCMITYGHEKFIEEAINGVLMQECDFDVELIIANDCSPDKTHEVIQNIIKTHPKASWIKYFRHEKNIGMLPNALFIFEQATGKYIANCEGDDYWIDNQKLQKQVGFLESNLDYVIHSSAALIHSDDKNDNTVFGFNENKFILSIEDFYTQNNLITATSVFRRMNLNYPDFIYDIKFFDWFTYIVLLKQSNLKVFISNEVYATYRVHDGGVMKSLDTIEINKTYINQIIRIKEFLKLEQYSEDDYKNINKYSISKFRALIDAKLYFEGLKTFLCNLKLSKSKIQLKKYAKYLFTRKI